MRWAALVGAAAPVAAPTWAPASDGAAQDPDGEVRRDVIPTEQAVTPGASAAAADAGHGGR